MALVGLLLFLPFYYQYSLVELILYSRLMTGTYDGPMSILRQSKEEMKGFKSHRLVLDLSLLGWQILSFFTLGMANFYVKPYATSCQIIFYPYPPSKTDAGGQSLPAKGAGSTKV